MLCSIVPRECRVEYWPDFDACLCSSSSSGWWMRRSLPAIRILSVVTCGTTTFAHGRIIYGIWMMWFRWVENKNTISVRLTFVLVSINTSSVSCRAYAQSNINIVTLPADETGRQTYYICLHISAYITSNTVVCVRLCAKTSFLSATENRLLSGWMLAMMILLLLLWWWSSARSFAIAVVLLSMCWTHTWRDVSIRQHRHLKWCNNTQLMTRNGSR